MEPPEDDVTPGEAVRLERVARGMSQVALGTAAGVDPSTVGRIERGIGEEPTKLGVLQAYLRIGPYATKRSPADEIAGVDLSDLTDSQLAEHLMLAAAELRRRFPPAPPRRPRRTVGRPEDWPDARRVSGTNYLSDVELGISDEERREG